MRPATTWILVALVLVVAILCIGIQNGMLERPAADEAPPILEFTGHTTLIASGISSISAAKTGLVQNADDVLLPYGVKKFDLVTLDQQSINREIRSGNGITITIRGQDYRAKLARMEFENIDDGIDSYERTLSEVMDSNILLTISDDGTVGSITLGDETFEIGPLEYRQYRENTTPLVHMIYSSRDVTPYEFQID